ncbi:ATP-dependent DNA helicase Q-like 4A [Bienertia sinuspersici]
MENLLSMVSYCENEVDCRRLLQLAHFGENFDPAHCKKTCDNCSKIRSSIEKDVTHVAMQLVELVKSVGQHFSSAHILEVFRGSLSQYVKKHKHNTLKLHGPGKVNECVSRNFFLGGQKIFLRFPSTAKVSALKFTKAEATLANTTLSSGKTSPPQSHNSKPDSEVDTGLGAKLYSALRLLRSALMREGGERVMAHHIFSNATLQLISKRVPRTKEELLEINGIGNIKLNRYGDRLLETIEATIKQYYKKDKNSSGSNDSADSVKRRREATKVSNGASNENDDILDSTGRSKKRAIKTGKSTEIKPLEADVFSDCLDDADLDFVDSVIEIHTNGSNSKNETNVNGRKLPTWSVK